MEKLLVMTARRLKLSEDDIDELRQNVVAAVLTQKQKWQKHLKEIVRNEAMALKRGTHQMMPLSEIDENLCFNGSPVGTAFL